MKSLTPLEGYEEFLRDIKSRIQSAQVRAALALSREVVLLYWHIGREIRERQERYGWGAKVVQRLAADLSGYIQHPRHGTKPGRYTDDTQMSIAIAEAIVSGEEWTPRMLADRFVKACKRDPPCSG